jgi:hypothetical protein
MKANVEIKASVLKTLLSEDRREVRDIRAAIYNIVSLLTVASFALTAFILKKKPPSGPTDLSTLADLVLLAFIWTFFLRYKVDLYHCRQGLKARQDLIRTLDEGDTSDLDPFPDARRVVPDIRDTELWWLPILATVGILVKMLIVWNTWRLLL